MDPGQPLAPPARRGQLIVMNLRILTVFALGLFAAAPETHAQEPVTVAVRPLESAAPDSAALVPIRDALLAALKADARIEVENVAQYVVIGGGARINNNATRLDLRIANVATGMMTPLSFTIPDGDRDQATANAARQVVVKVLELAGRS